MLSRRKESFDYLDIVDSELEKLVFFFVEMVYYVSEVEVLIESLDDRW